MMTTQLERARSGQVTAAMRKAARTEGVDPQVVRREIARGRAVIPANPAHVRLEPSVIGRAFRTKVNANIGFSPEQSQPGREMDKLRVALKAGADCLMDLSVGEHLDRMRYRLLRQCPVPFGTVPIYEALARVKGRVERLDEALLLEVIRAQAEQGVDFMTLHAGLLRKLVPLALRRKLGIVSRGGAILARWMEGKGRENPFYSRWNEILEICRRHDVTVSLGDGLRPGCLADASDRAQFGELKVLGALVATCHRAGVQVMVEGPGHVPFNQIRMNVERQQSLCCGAPFYVLGPIVMDAAPGYDHITAAIGATEAAFHGASLLCYVTPAEHLALPTSDEVRTGVVAFRIAAHAADVARGLPGARDRDDAISDARRTFDWKGQFRLALDGSAAEARFMKGRQAGSRRDHCSMCGRDFCAIRASGKLVECHGASR